MIQAAKVLQKEQKKKSCSSDGCQIFFRGVNETVVQGYGGSERRTDARQKRKTVMYATDALADHADEWDASLLDTCVYVARGVG